jgi:glycosyltransferase involved in cell wall biosynthesis
MLKPEVAITATPRPDRTFHLAWVVPGRLDQLTGGYLYDASVVAWLKRRGHAVEVVELPHPGPLRGAAHIGALAARSFDAVVIDELAHPAMLLGVPTLHRLRPVMPVVALVHHLRCSEPASPGARWRTARLERLALAGADHAICTSFSTAAALRRLVRRPLPISVASPGCDLHSAPAHSGPNHAPGDHRPLRLLCVAHWTPRKGILELLAALERVSAPVELTLVGDPARDANYAAQVRAALVSPTLVGRVNAPGRVTSSQLAALYATADAFVLASSHEGYGIVLAEAMAAGLPIVATRVGAVPEVVRDGQEAELVPFGDLAALASALDRLACDSVERARRAAFAHLRSASLPTWEQTGAAVEAVLRGAIAAGRAGHLAVAVSARKQPGAGRGI